MEAAWKALLPSYGLCYNLPCRRTWYGGLMPGYEHVTLEIDPGEHIAKLTLDRPQRRNALNQQTLKINALPRP